MIIIFFRTGVDFLLNALREVNNYFLDAGMKAKELLSDKSGEMIELLEKYEGRGLVEMDGVEKNTREEHPDWFKGLETNSKTKNEYMYKKSQDRIRGYLYKFREDVRKNDRYVTDGDFRKKIESCLNFFKCKLKTDGYYGCYFDRTFAESTSDYEKIDSPEMKRKKSKSNRKNEIIAIKENMNEGVKKLLLNFKNDDENELKISYCDRFGNFQCQGHWNENKCNFDKGHRINPYASRETRILFSTWNFDHRLVA